MEILIDNRQKKFEISEKEIRQTARVILDALDSPDGELSIIIVDDGQMERLNKKYLNRCGPTNVIAFPMLAGDYSDITPHLLGDVAISVETAEREGKTAKIRRKERVTQLLVHGILHLFGYDHEKSEKEAAEMEAESDTLLRLIV